MDVKFYAVAGANLKISAHEDMIDRAFEAFEISELKGEKDLIEWIVEEDKAPVCEDQKEELECPVPGYRMVRIKDEIWLYLEENEDNRVEMIRLQDNFQRAIFYVPHLGFEHDWEYYAFARESFFAVSRDVFCLAMLKRGGIVVKGSAIGNHGMGTILSSDNRETEAEIAEYMGARYGMNILSRQMSVCRVVVGRIRIYSIPWSDDADKRVNRNLPLQSLVLAERAEQDSIAPVSREDATKLLATRALFPAWYKDSEKEIYIVAKRIVMSVVGCFRLESNLPERASQLARVKMEACSLL